MRIKKYFFMFIITIVIVIIIGKNNNVFCAEKGYYRLLLEDKIKDVLTDLIKSEEFKNIYATNLFYYTHIGRSWFIEKFLTTISWNEYLLVLPEEQATRLLTDFIKYVEQQYQNYMNTIINNLCINMLYILKKNPDIYYIMDANLLSRTNTKCYFFW